MLAKSIKLILFSSQQNEKKKKKSHKKYKMKSKEF